MPGLAVAGADLVAAHAEQLDVRGRFRAGVASVAAAVGEEVAHQNGLQLVAYSGRSSSRTC